MNANELIEHEKYIVLDLLNRKQKREDRLNKLQESGDVDFIGEEANKWKSEQMKPLLEKIQYHNDIIRELSRTRIRETATEPPTREDADKDGFIQAYHEAAGWMVHTIKTVNFHPENYLFWTRMPDDPEVTP